LADDEACAYADGMSSSSALRLFAIAATIAAPLALAACAKNNPSVPAGSDPEKVSRAEYDLAQDEWRHGRLRSAMDHAMKASLADELHAEAHHFVSIVYLALCQMEGDCRLEQAEIFARKAVVADPEYRPAKHTLGMLLVQEKKYDDAIAVLAPLAEDIIYKTPELAWYDLGGAYLGKGEADKAIDALS
jgi:type IV pilus assembly protein PilF